MNKDEILKKVNYYNEYFKDYGYIIQIFSFDHSTIAPKNSMEEGNKALSRIANDMFKVSKSEDYESYVVEAYLHKDEFNDNYKRLFELNYRAYLKNKNITPEFDYEFSLAQNEGYTSWLKAKEKKDYSLFEPSLNKLVELTRKKIELEGNRYDTYYDTLLDEYEPGNNEKILDSFFNELKNGIIPLVKKIVKEGRFIREDFLNYNVPLSTQEKMSLWLLNFNDFDMDSGVISTTEHPFTCFPSEHDTRVTTHYFENLFLSNVFSVVHEGGHAIFGQNEPHEFFEIGLNDHMTSAMHETISRFYENIIARNPHYLKHLYKKTMELCGDTFKDVSFEEFSDGVNIAKPSLVRTEADELTYSVHILIRYEIEKGLIDGTLSTKDLNKVWNEKYKEYLGIEPENDAEGILQDVHWSDASFGYFPSYALGNAYGVMILNKMKEEINFEDLLDKGNMKEIKNWLKNNVFSKASLMDPNEWIKSVTGRDFTAKDYLDYLNEKYSKIYLV